ncbi:AMP-dependent synthetase [Streptomyces sp. NPDC060198]|uniref:AMP-dependent synthetase n=1 Tax=Streptomyces sp. NPDC060198 TaxID=3347070 RepID=UPI00364E858A
MRAVEAVLHRCAEDPDRPLVEVAGATGRPAVSHPYREITRAARGLGDRLAAGRGGAGHRALRIGVFCGDTPEFAVTELALLALRATGCPVPPGASARTAAALLAGVDAVVADAPGRARLDAWGDSRVVPPGCPVTALDTAELAASATGPYRVAADPRDWICKILAAPGADGPGSGARAGVRGHAVATLLDSLRAEVPPATFSRCAVTLPLSAPVQTVAAVPLTVLDRGCLVLPPGPGSTAPLWTASARPTALAVTPALAVAFVCAARVARREGRPVASALFGTDQVPLLWCGAEVPDSLIRELDSLRLPVHAGLVLPENACLVSWNTPAARRAGTVGRPLAHVRAGLGTDGELLLSGTEETADPIPGKGDPGRAVVDGWLHTGLRAAIDADGFIHLVGPARPEAPGEPAGPEIGRLLYSLVRSMRPQSVVGFGGGIADALDQLAAGARANGTGQVTGFLPDPRRAAAARARLTALALTRWAAVREAGVHGLGLPPADGPAAVDLALLDCRADLALPALTVLEPRLRPGSIVIAVGSAATGPYLDRVRDGEEYLSIALPVGPGLEVSTRLTPGPGPDSFHGGTRPGVGPAAPTRQPSGE